MGFFSRKQEASTPDRPTPIEIKWSFDGSRNETVTSVGANNPDAMNDREMAVLVAKAHSLNWGDADRGRGIVVKGWRKR